VAKAKGLEREMRGKLWRQKLGRENRNWRFDGDFKVKEIFFSLRAIDRYFSV
jgi:hypothetical protein